MFDCVETRVRGHFRSTGVHISDDSVMGERQASTDTTNGLD